MVKSCCAVGCHNKYQKGSGIQFYRIPKDADRRARWIAAISRKDWSPNEFSWLCSEHFVSKSKSDNPLNPDYVPSVFKHTNTPTKRRLQKDQENFERKQALKRRRIENTLESAAGDDDDHSGDENQLASPTDHDTDAVMYEKSMEVQQEKQQNCNLQEDVTRLRQENDVLKKLHQESKSRLSIKDVLRSDDKKVKYYTGLPSYTILKVVFDFVCEEMPNSIANCKLSPFEQFVMTLMKLRYNFGDANLGYRFGVDKSTVSRYFSKWLELLYVKLSFLIMWPNREDLLKTMPLEFRRHFWQCMIIIDCFEIFIEWPTALLPRAQTWSNYKHHNTIKYLIGVTPQRSIGFISKGWGSRISDVHLTENSGLLEKLMPGDIVLADRGFTIEDTVKRLYCAEVKLPAFTKSKKQLSAMEVESSQRLSRVRIHVERVIGMLRQNYTILKSTLPIPFLWSKNSSTSLIDKIVTVCAALCNCCDSVIPFDK